MAAISTADPQDMALERQEFSSENSLWPAIPMTNAGRCSTGLNWMNAAQRTVEADAARDGPRAPWDARTNNSAGASSRIQQAAISPIRPRRLLPATNPV